MLPRANMGYDTIHERYRELACASLEQGINDYLDGTDSEQVFEEWTGESVMFDYLNLDRIWIVERVKYLKRCGVKHIGGIKSYGRRI